MRHQATLISGDGIGPEVTRAAYELIQRAGVAVDWEEVFAGAAGVAKHGEPMHASVVDSIRRTRVALKGPLETPIGKGYRSVNVALRAEFDLYACVRPVRSIPGLPSVFKNVDLVIVRENTEGLYAGKEHLIAKGVAETLKIVTEAASTRIAAYAFALAHREKRRRVTVAHKANIMKITDGLFLDCARKIAAANPDIEYNELIVDNTAMQLVIRPERFDVLLTDNLYGDILSDEAAGLVGGLGVVPGANIGDDIAIFEAVHGSAPDIAGQGLANPVAVILSAAMMLRHLGEPDAATRLESATRAALADPAARTRDLGGPATTATFTAAVAARL
ncbi:MAG: isocitrate/isopropylmalate dehydrogenase family protein [Deltaproteobacteria bacterium]|nr:isocitrate/isopropylmalate dehydrogenase family protein [Deltaproteobacteria bacterium]